MSKLIFRLIPTVTFWGIFIFVVLQIPYPDSLTQANFMQVSLFFASLFLALLTTFNLFLKNIFLSSSVALGLIFLLILKALDSLDFVTTALTLLAVGLLFSYFKKINRHSSRGSGFRNLTNQTKIPKLTRLR